MSDSMTPIQLSDSERTRCEVWSRCMGYHRPISWWNPGKQQEHRDRVNFREPGNCEPAHD
jgi:anaerobic ribonucleoside-triphosphate reductase